MELARRKRTRDAGARKVRSVHRTLALLALAPLLLQAGSGGALTFADELQRWAIAQRSAMQGDASLEAIVASAALASGGKVVRVEFPTTGSLVYVCHVASAAPSSWLVDTSGNALGPAPLLVRGLHVLREFHESLMLGSIGHVILALAGAALAGLGVTGLWMGWPKGSLIGVLRLQRHSSPVRRAFEQHRATGFLIGAILVALGLTGLTMSVRTLAPQTQRIDRPHNVSPSPPLPSEVLHRLRHAYGEVSIRDVRLDDAGRLRRVILHSGVRGLVDRIDLDPASGAVRSATLSQPMRERLLDWVYPVHSGKAFGWPAQLALLLATLGAIVLAVTGMRLWLRRPSTPAPWGRGGRMKQ